LKLVLLHYLVRIKIIDAGNFINSFNLEIDNML